MRIFNNTIVEMLPLSAQINHFLQVLFRDTPGGRVDSVHLVTWSSMKQVFPRFRHRCNTDRPAPAAGRPLLPPVCPREDLTSKTLQLESTNSQLIDNDEKL